jgi:hypothetical protein
MDERLRCMSPLLRLLLLLLLSMGWYRTRRPNNASNLTSNRSWFTHQSFLSVTSRHLVTKQDFKGDKILSTPSFGAEVKLWAPCRYICDKLKDPTSMKVIFSRQNSFPSPCSPALLLDDCWYNCQRALVDKSRVFLVDIITPWFSMLIYHLGDKQ